MSDDPIARILAAIADVRTETSGLRTEVSGLRAEMSAFRTQLREELERLSSDMLRLGNDFLGMQNELTALKAEVTGLGTALNRVRLEVVGRLDRVQDSVTDLRQNFHRDLERLREDMAVNFGASERVECFTRQAGEEVRDMSAEIIGIKRQIMKLQEDVRQLRGEA